MVPERPGQDEHADDDTYVRDECGHRVNPTRGGLSHDVGFAVDSISREDADHQTGKTIDADQQRTEERAAAPAGRSRIT